MDAEVWIKNRYRVWGFKAHVYIHTASSPDRHDRPSTASPFQWSHLPTAW